MPAGRWLLVSWLALALVSPVSAAIVIDMPPAPPAGVTATTQIYDAESSQRTLGEIALARYAWARTAPMYTYVSRPWWGYGGYYGLGWAYAGYYLWGGYGWGWPRGYWHSWGWGWNRGLWWNRPIVFRCW